MKRFILALLLAPAALGATYNVALPGGGVLTVNGLPYVNPGITNSASVVWGVDGTGLLYATATGTNSSIVYVEGAAVAGPNFGLSTEVDPAVTAGTNITFSLVDGSITTNKIDANFHALLLAGGGSGDVTAAGTNNFTGPNSFAGTSKFTGLATLNGGWTPFTNNTRVVFEGDSLSTYIGNEGQTNWSKYITNYFPGLNLTASANAATSGQQISQMLTDYAAQVQPYKPSGGTNAILFFWAGLNDVYYTNYTTALTRLTNYWAGAKADGFTLVGFTLTDSTFLTAQTRANLSVINNLIRQQAPLYCDYFVDVAELLNDVQDTNSSSAGVHYTSRANEILAEHVRWTLLQGGFFHRRITGTRNYPDNSFRSLSFVSNASPSAMVGGGLAFDADAHAAGRGALVLHDGTSNTVVVAVQESDTPSNGQFPRWNTGGTITWETPAATGDGSALTNLNASNIASGTISSNRLPADIALTSLSAGTLTATSVAGDGSGLTNLNGSNIASGTVADARIPATLARTNAPTLHSPTLLGSPTVPTAAAGTSNTVAASTKYVDDAVAAGGSGGSGTRVLLGRSAGIVELVSSTSETSMFSVTVPTGTFTTNSVVRVKIIGDLLNDTGGPATLTFKSVFGPTTLYQDGVSQGASASRKPFTADVLLSAVNSLSAQAFGGLLTVGTAGGATTGIGDFNTDETTSTAPIFGTGSTDTSTNNVLDIRFSHSTNSANASLRIYYAEAVLE